MVSQDSPSNSNSSILHQFIISTSIANQNELRNHHFDPYAADSIPTSPYNPHFFSPSIYAPQLTDETRLDRDRRLSDLLGPSTEVSQQAHRLSLSLGSLQSRQRSLNSSNFVPPGYIISGPPPRESCNTNDVPFAGNIFPAMNQSCSTSYGTESFAAAIGSSKYLKPAQSLLEEMVGIGGEDIDLSNQKYVEKLSRKKGSFGVSFDLKAEFSNNEIMIEKRETYLNLVKLLALLEEVERRYEEYYHHMEKTVSSFEVIAGLGAGKSYTALALQAMSKHFFSLWNAILCQIRATRRKMMKDMPRISSGLSELSLSDQEVRQHSRRMSLQHLGIIQTSRQLCRPIRGLPETSVTILRAWLFEHFLHPYPNDSEKIMLASQTGLTKNQVSNWFINARVRLWKPMIEEMYKEEFAESSIESDQVLTTREGLADSAED